MSVAKELYLEERRQKILTLLDEQGRVSVAELSRQLGVSEVTIRADLHALAEQNLVIRTHGGAIPSAIGRNELALTRRRQRQVQAKDRIGQACAPLIHNAQSVLLDSSSTALTIAQHLKNHHRLTIVTNSLAVSQEMVDAPGVKVVMPGGTLQPETASLVGTMGLDMLKNFNIQTGFFGAHGLSIPEGLTDVSAEEAEIKRAMVEMCRTKIAVLDATKWGQVGLASFAQLDQFDIIITDAHAPAEQVEQVQKQGIEVFLV